jgi:hypothetical protein
MSYTTAKACFTENRDSVNRRSDPQLYNLNQGLLNLTKQLQSDIDELNRKLKRLESLLLQR